MHKFFEFWSIFSVLRKSLNFGLFALEVFFLLLSFSFFRLEFSWKCTNGKPEILQNCPFFKRKLVGFQNILKISAIIYLQLFAKKRQAKRGVLGVDRVTRPSLNTPPGPSGSGTSTQSLPNATRPSHKRASRYFSDLSGRAQSAGSSAQVSEWGLCFSSSF